MRNSLIAVIQLVLVTALFGCAATMQKNTSSVVRATYFNPNPAPENMSPPDMDADPVLDATHVRTKADYHYAIGEAYSLDGESERAIEEFKLVTVYDPNSSTVRLRLAGEYLKQGLLTEAVEQAEKGLHLDANNLEVRIFLGGLYAALKMYRQALDQYQKVLKQDPQHPDVPLYLGALYAEQGSYVEAVKYFEFVAYSKGHSKQHLAYYYIGKVYSSQLSEKVGEKKQNVKSEVSFRKAEQSYSQSLQIKSDFEEGALALYDLYEFGGLKSNAVKLLESFQAQFGPKKAFSYQLSQYYLEAENYEMAYKHLTDLEAFEPANFNVKMKMALILIEQKKYDQAIDRLEVIAKFSPSSDKIRFYLAAVYEEIGKDELAIKNFSKIEPTSTYYAEAIVHAAYLHRKRNDLKGAVSTMEAAIQARNDVPQFYSFYASILDENKEYSRGVALLEKAIVQFPDNTQIRFYLGSMYEKTGKVENAILEMRRILAVDTEHIQALNYLAYTFAEQNQSLDEAEELARRAMNLQPNDPFILDTVGWVLFRQGRAEEAIQYLEAAHKLKPDEAIVAEHLGDAYYVFELIEKAKKMYQQAVVSESDQSKKAKIQSKINSIALQLNEQRGPASSR